MNVRTERGSNLTDTARPGPDADAAGPATPDGGAALAVLAVGLAAGGAVAWLALVTAQLGRFQPRLALAAGALAALGAALGMAGRRPARRALAADRWGLATVALAVGVAVAHGPAGASWPVALDASWYLNTSAWIARSGSLDFRPGALALLPTAELRRAFVSTFDDQRASLDPSGERFPAGADVGFHAVGLAIPAAGEARAAPFHPALNAAGLAVAGSLLGTGRAAVVALLWAALWLLAVAALARALAGDPAGALAVPLAGLGPGFAYYASQPYAELAAGACLVGGLGLLVGRRPRPLAAGLALGLAALTKVDTLPWVAAILLGGAWSLARGDEARPSRAAGLLLAGAAPGLLHLAWLLAGTNAVYARLNGLGILKLARLHASTLLLGAGALALLALALRLGRRRPSPATLLRSAGIALLAGLAAGQLAAWLAPPDAVPSMGAVLAWLMTPLGLWAGLAGAAGLWAGRPDRRLAPIAAMLLLALPQVLLAPLVSRGLSPLYAGRRLMIGAVPLVAALGAVFLARLWHDPGPGSQAGTLGLDRLPAARRRVLAIGALAIIALGSYQAATPFRRGRGHDLPGAGRLMADLAERTEPDAVLVFPSILDGRQAGRLASAMEAVHGRATAVLGRPDADLVDLAAAVRAWRAAGRPVYLVQDGEVPAPELPGLDLEPILPQASIVTRILAPSPRWPATMTNLPLAIDLYRVGDIGAEAKE